MHPKVAHYINKERGNFNLSNKFEYGMDKLGGPNHNLPKDAESPAKIKDCLDKSAVGHGQREEFKEKIERQNFTIQHDKKLVNSETKYIGTHGGRGVENIID